MRILASLVLAFTMFTIGGCATTVKFHCPQCGYHGSELKTQGETRYCPGCGEEMMSTD